MSNSEEGVKIGRDYGIKANLRQTTSNIIYPIELLRKLGIFLAITIKRLIVSILLVFTVIAVACIVLFTSQIRLMFLWLPVLILTIACLMFLGQYAFINPSFGSFLSIGKSIAVQQKESKAVRKGKLQRDRAKPVVKVEEDGLIMFENGDVGRILIVDGSTSLVAFPSEIREQELRAIRYHNSRERTTTEVEITSSQRQNAEKQINNIKSMIRSNTNPAIISMLQQDGNFLESKVNGKKSTIVQYKLMRDKTMKGLELSLEHIYRFEAEGYYYSVIELGQKETEEIIKDLYYLR